MKTYNRIMMGVICSYCLFAMGLAMYAATVKAYQSPAKPQVENVECDDYWENNPMDGQCFSTEYVDEEYEYDECGAIRYSDPDANQVDCEILLTAKSYQEVCQACSKGLEWNGELKQVDTIQGSPVFSIIWECSRCVDIDCLTLIQ